MKWAFKRVLTTLLALLLILGIAPMNAFAAETRYNDTYGHWAAPAIERWSDYGVLSGYAGLFRPDDSITRAEFATVLYKVIGYTAQGANQFSDVDSGKWYYEAVAKLAAAGIMLGSDGKARPEDDITREEAAALISRAFSIPENTADPKPFGDAATISAWAAGYVGGLHAEGYITGKPGNVFDPRANITRAEAVTILDNMVKAFYSSKGEYSSDISGSAVIRSDDVTLKDSAISRNLYLMEGIGNGNAALNNVTVAGTTYIRGGGPNSIKAAGGALGVVVLNSLTGTHLELSADTSVAKLIFLNSGSVTFGGVTVSFDAAEGALTLGGTFDKVVLNADGTMTVTAGGVTYDIIPPAGKVTTLTLTEGSVVREMDLSAPLHIKGTGQIDKMKVHASGSTVDDGVKVKLENIIVDKGIAITVDGKVYTGTGGSLTAGDAGGAFSTSDPNSVVVSFQTNGGSAVSPVRVTRGETLSSLPMPSKNDCSFTGWFTDDGLSEPFYSDVPIMGDTTLYAQYAEKDYNIEERTDPNKYVADCPADFEVNVLSPVTLTPANLSDYVELTAVSPCDSPALTVAASGESYTIKPLPPSLYEEGCLYKLTLKNENLSFDGEAEGVRELSFRIHKAESEIVEFRDGIINVLWDDAINLGENTFSIPADKYGEIKAAFDANTAYNNNKSNPDEPDRSVILRFWNGTFDDGDLEYRKATAVTLIADSDGYFEYGGKRYVEHGDVLLLVTEDCLPGEIYKKVDVYGEEMLPAGDLLSAVMSLDTDQIAEQVKNSEGAAQLTDILNNALSQSETLQSLLAEPDGIETGMQPMTTGFAEGFRTPSEGSTTESIPVYFFDIQGLDVTCTVKGTNNANFPIEYLMSKEEWSKEYPELADEYPNVWPVMTLTFTYTATINNKIKIDAVFEVKEFLTATLAGWCKYGGELFYPSTWDDLSFDYSLFLYSQTDLNLSIIAKSVNRSDEYKYDINITEEIQKLMNDDKTDDSDPAAILEKVLGDKGDYLELVEANLMEITVSILELVQIEFKLDFVVKINFAAGISSRFTYLCSQEIGVTGDIDAGEVNTYKHALDNNGAYQFDLYAAGYLGLKAGLRGSVAVSVVGLKDVGKVGVKLEVGAYMDIYGFIHLNILKYGDHRHTGSNWQEVPIRPAQISIQGAIFMETGVYVETGLFLESTVFNLRLDVPFYEYRLPILAMGDRYALLKFKNNSDKITMTDDALPLLGAGGLLEAEYVDMKTGKRVAGNYAKLDRFVVQFSSPAFKIVGNDIVFDKSLLKDVARADTDVAVYYKGGSLNFSHSTSSIDLGNFQERALKDINMGALNHVRFLAPFYTKEDILEMMLDEEYSRNIWKANLLGDEFTTIVSGPGISLSVFEYEKYKAMILRLFEDDSLFADNYNSNNAMLAEAKLIRLSWIDSDVFEELGGEADIFKPVKATYILNVNGAETVLEEREILPGLKPGAPNTGSSSLFWYQWLQLEKNISVKSYDDFNRPILRDTVYNIYAVKPQKLVTFITFYNDKWHFDVYAVNVGDVPTPTAGYDNTLSCLGWATRQYGYSSKKAGELVPVSWNPYVADANEYLYEGLDTAGPLYSVSGSFQHCEGEYIKAVHVDGAEYYKASQYIYEAQYVRPACAITVKFSNMTSPVVLEVPYGNPIRLRGDWFDDSMGYRYAGIDMGDDGTVDYPPDYVWDDFIKDPPYAYGDMTLTMLYDIKTYTVTVQNHLGDPTSTLLVNYGDLPGILDTKPEHPDNPGEYNFIYWDVSKSGGEFARWKKIHDPFVREDWVIRPVYAINEQMVRFLFTHDDTATMHTAYLSPGDYRISEVLGFTPSGYTSEGKRYVLYAWERDNNGEYILDDAFTVADKDIVIVAVYMEEADTRYTVTFNTTYGELSKGSLSYGELSPDGKTFAFKAEHDEYEAMAEEFIAINNALGPVTTEDKVYTFGGWSLTDIDEQNRTVQYGAAWSGAIREFTVVFDAGEGRFTNAQSPIINTWPYGSSYDLSQLAGSTVKDIADGKEYILTGWMDQDGNNYGIDATITVTGDITLTARFAVASTAEYTITIYPIPGELFAGGYSYKQYKGAFGEPTNIDIDFEMYDDYSVDQDVSHRQVFDGWYQSPGDTKLSAFPAVFGGDQDITIDARIKQVTRYYTITFSGNGGKFESGEATVSQAYEYGDTIQNVPTPTRDDDFYFSYTFNGWDRPLGEVTNDEIYSAVWTKTQKTSAPPLPSGIFISDGTTTEDINCVNAGGGHTPIQGYAYSLKEYFIADPGSGDLTSYYVPTLTITGNGLTVSGSVDEGPAAPEMENTVSIFVAESVTDVTFDDLSLTVLFEQSEVISIDSADVPLTITISGECGFEKLRRDDPAAEAYSSSAIRSYRETVFEGADGSALLTITANKAMGVSSYADVTFKSITMSVDASGIIREYDYGDGYGVVYKMAAAFDSDNDSRIRFIDANVTVHSPGSLIFGSVEFIGNTTFEYSSTESVAPVLEIAEDLIFEDFTGMFSLSFDEPGASAPAVTVRGSIRFIVDGAEVDPEEYYDLGGARIAMITVEDEYEEPYEYYTFADENGDPLSSVTILPLGAEPFAGGFPAKTAHTSELFAALPDIRVTGLKKQARILRFSTGAGQIGRH